MDWTDCAALKWAGVMLGSFCIALNFYFAAVCLREAWRETWRGKR